MWRKYIIPSQVDISVEEFDRKHRIWVIKCFSDPVLDIDTIGERWRYYRILTLWNLIRRLVFSQLFTRIVYDKKIKVLKEKIVKLKYQNKQINEIRSHLINTMVVLWASMKINGTNSDTQEEITNSMIPYDIV